VALQAESIKAMKSLIKKYIADAIVRRTQEHAPCMSDIQAWDRELRISRRKSDLAGKRAGWRQLQANVGDSESSGSEQACLVTCW
jgi:hypothetical protein